MLNALYLQFFNCISFAFMRINRDFVIIIFDLESACGEALKCQKI